MGPIASLPASAAGEAKAAPTAAEAAEEEAPARKKKAMPSIEELADEYFPGEVADAAPRRLFRLTRDQLDMTVKWLLPRHYQLSVKETMAKDPLQTNYEFAELLSLNDANLSPLRKWIAEIAARVRKDPAGIIDCPAPAAGGTADVECLKREAERFVLRAFRGDVMGEKTLARLSGFFVDGVKASGQAKATGDLVEATLNSPEFLFRKELITGKRGQLAPTQLLAALTYTMADVPPQKLGLEPSEAVLHLQPGDNGARDNTVKSILASPDAREKLVRFLKAWLEIKEPAEFRISQQAYPEFTPKLAQAMADETDRFLRQQLSKPRPSLKDITQSSETFVSKALEGIYETKPADAAGSKPVQLDPARRLGIFTQPAVLASHSGPVGTQPIKRGVFWVRKVMCRDLDPPPQGLDISLYESEATTERKRIEQSTNKTACIGCHKIIDPFGFAFESYDAIGRWREKDNGFPVDTSIKIDFLDEPTASTNTPVEALRVLTSSVMFKQCFVRQAFRFYMGRKEEPTDDRILKRMFLQFAANDDQDILQLVATLAAADPVVRRQQRSSEAK